MTQLLEFCGAFFRERGVETYLVGGALRDELLGRESHDLDFAVARDALPLARELADRVRGAYFPIDAERETARVLVPDGTVDVALLRGASILADLAARDFTVNAMARRVDTPGAVLDPHGGRRDLAARLVRVVSREALDRDPARLLRAVRLAATLGFAVEPQTGELIHARAHLARDVSAERVRDELVRILELPRSGAALGALKDFGLLAPALPGARVSVEPLETLARREDFAEQADDADEARQWLAGELGRRLPGGRTRLVLFKLAALYEDAHAIGHDTERLHFSRHEVEYAEALVRHRKRLSEATPDELGAFRYFRQTGVAAISLLADALAADRHAETARRYALWYRDAFDRVVAPKPLVPGAEIAALMGGQDARIGRAIVALLEAQITGAVRSRDDALAFLADYPNRAEVDPS